MPYVRTRIDFTNGFEQHKRSMNELARRSVAAGAQAGAAVASSIAAQRSKTGAMARIVPTPVTPTGDGWQASFASRVFYAWFQEEGTLGNRRKPLKQAPRTDRTRAPGTGVEPLRFMRAGRAAGRRAMLETTRAGMPR